MSGDGAVYSGGSRKYCHRCWPDRQWASHRGAFGYGFLCETCYGEMMAETVQGGNS